MVDHSKIKIPEFNPVDMTNLPRKLPKVEIDSTKCTVPFWCKKCLEICDQMIFRTETTRDERLKETDPRVPGLYRIFAVRRDKCTTCGKCVEHCPVGALTVTFGDTVLKGTVHGPNPAEEAKNSPYPLIDCPKAYSFDLNEDMIDALRQEFDPEKLIEKFSKAIAGKNKSETEKIAKDVFSEFGKAWMEKVVQYGEEYPDRTYEVLKEAIDLTGDYFFPHVPQRLLEIAYLSTQKFLNLTVLNNFTRRLVYQVPECQTFNLLTEKCGAEVASQMPCQHACAKALEVLNQKLEMDTTFEVKKRTAKDGVCEFSITKI